MNSTDESSEALVHQDAQPVAAEPRNPEVFAAIMAAVKDPETDPDRLDRFLAIYRQLEKDRAQAQFNAAFARVKINLPTIDKRGVIPDNQGRVRSRFARHDDLHRAITPILTAEGLASSFMFQDAGEGRMTCKMTLTHAGGHSQEYQATGPWSMDIPKATPNQKARAAQSYMKRNLMIDVFDILCEELDDDGSGLGVAEPISDEQVQTLEGCLETIEERKPGSRKRFFDWLETAYQTRELAELRQGAVFEAVFSMLKRKLAEGK